ncbi:MAG: hypothetical protein Q9168_003671 [Polycauliona sp. 1 TL-2023]
MTKKVERNGLKKEVPSHVRSEASLVNGSRLSNTNAVTRSPNPDVHQPESTRSTGNDKRLVFEVYADKEGQLKLATASVMENGEKVIIDAFAPRLQEHNDKYYGSRSQNVHARRSFDDSALEGNDNTPDADSEDDSSSNQDSEDQDDGEPLLEIESEQFDILTPGDVKALEDYYSKGFCQVGQLIMKKVLKEWVKVKQPKKQSANPYNGGKEKAQEEKERVRAGHKRDPNAGDKTVPDYWPDQKGWPSKGCRHREPDHLKKPERTILAMKLLSLTGCDETFTVDKLFDSTKDIKMRADQKRMLEQLYKVRKTQQAFQSGEIDATTRIPVYRLKGQPSQKKRKMNPNRERNARKPKQERRDTPEAVEQSIGGTPASTSGSVRSFGSPIPSLPAAKVEPQDPTGDLRDYVRAQYAPSNDRGPFEPMMPNLGVSYGATYDSGNQFPLGLHNFMQDIPLIPPFAQHPCPMENPMASTPSDRGRVPFRNGSYYPRRPTSVCNQNSPSFQDGAIPREKGYEYSDDFCLQGFRPPQTSCGYPITGLSIPLKSPRNHPHGLLSPDEQQRICMMHGCSNYRSWEDHQQGAARNGWQVSVNDHQGNMPPSHSLDASAIDKLMFDEDEDFTPDPSLSRSFGQQ